MSLNDSKPPEARATKPTPTPGLAAADALLRAHPELARYWNRGALWKHLETFAERLLIVGRVSALED